jgi:hypothetical protein
MMKPYFALFFLSLGAAFLYLGSAKLATLSLMGAAFYGWIEWEAS